MKWAKIIFRILLSSILLLASGDIFFRFLEHPEPPIEARDFLISLNAAGYILPSVGAAYLIAAVLLLIRRTVGLGLVVLAPVTVNLILYHWFLDPGLSSTALRDYCLVGLHLGTAGIHWKKFRSLFSLE